MEKGDFSSHGPEICGEASGDVMLCSRGSALLYPSDPGNLKNFTRRYDGAKSRIDIAYLPSYIARVEAALE